jgi:hypothetical protein
MPFLKRCKQCGCLLGLIQRASCICKCHGALEPTNQRPKSEAAMAVMVG